VPHSDYVMILLLSFLQFLLNNISLNAAKRKFSDVKFSIQIANLLALVNLVTILGRGNFIFYAIALLLPILLYEIYISADRIGLSPL
jgi:hypothetical protein